MKKLLFILTLAGGCFTSFIYSADTESEIKEVTVYQSNARIVRVATLNLQPGNSEIVLTDLANTLQQNTLQAEIEGNAILLSASARLNYLTKKGTSKQVKMLQDSLDLIDGKLKLLAGEKQVFNGEEKAINDNIKLGSEQTGVQVNELKMLAEFYRTRLMDIKKQVITIEEQEQDFKTARIRIQNQLNQLNAMTNKPVGEVVLNVSANAPVKVKVRFSYLVPNAGWYPIYDIRSVSTDKPINLVYKANVFQSTNYDWKDVRLTISTRNPEADQNRPVLNPWFIDFYQPQAAMYPMKKAQVAPALSNVYQETRAKESAAEESAPEYKVTETTGLLAAEYSIENLQSIPADGKEHLVPMKEYEVPAIYSYHAVPKLSDGVFLLAKLTDFGKLNLLPGEANLFNRGMYVGKSEINPFTTSDTLLISLGRDEQISIKRTELQDLTARQTIGTNIKETKGYEISVKNNKSIPVNIEILDNIPISKNKEIEVTLENDDGADYMKDYGKLLWRINLKPGESKKIRFSFMVKYPKDKVVSGI